MRRSVLMAVVFCVSPAFAQAQSIPQPSGPVVFCGTQAPPAADSYELIFDGAAPEALVMDPTLNAACPAGSTHSFSVPASRFTLGQHTLVIRATNAFGSTDGPSYVVTVGIAPGPFTNGAVLPPGGGGE